MGKKISLGHLSFSTKKEAEAFFREIRDRYQDGEILSSNDEWFLNNLLQGHPDREQKIAGGVKAFSVQTVQYGTRCFVIHREHGTSTEFSFLSCIRGENIISDRNKALREEVSSQIEAFRRETFILNSITCPITNEVLSIQTCHIDHAPPFPFATLVQAWLEHEGISFDEIIITQPSDNQFLARMTDDQQKRSWSSFHKRMAILRAVAPIANLSDLRKK